MLDRSNAVVVYEFVAIAAMLVGATVVEVIYKLGPPARSLDNVFTATLASLLTAYCALLFVSEYRRGRLFSPLSLYAALVGVHFALPGLLLSAELMRFRYDPNIPYLADCLFFVLLCLVLLQVGTLLAARRSIPNHGEKTSLFVFWSVNRLVVMLTCLIIVGWIARLYLISQGAYFQLDRANAEISVFGAAFVLLELFPFYAYALALVSYFHRIRMFRTSRWWLSAVTVLGAAEFAYWIGAGRKLEPILVLVLAAVVRYLAMHRLPSFKVMLLGAFATVLIFPATFYYRYSLETEFGLGTGIAWIPQIIEQATTVVDDAGPATDIILNRFNLTESVSATMRLVETGEWQLRGGSSYADIFLILIPRFIWKDKPDYHYGTEFGHASGLSSLSDQLTSISVTYYGEAFLNLGWFGCLFFLAIGFLAEKLYLTAKDQFDPKWLLLYCLSLPPLLYVGGTVALYFGGLIRLLMLFFAVALVLENQRVLVRFARSPLKSISNCSFG